MARIIDLTGRRFGSWLVVKKADALDRQGKPTWECACECGTIATVKGSDLRMGKSTKCIQCRPKKHGHTSGGVNPSSTYATWQAMKRRCLSPSSTHYSRYGGRGIAVCEQWMTFANFLADMGEKPTTRHTLERIDNNGNYEPNNCRWATRKEQGRNRSSSRVIEYNGVSMSIIEWCETLGIPDNIVRGRLKLGWTFSEAVETPIMHERTRDHGKFQKRC